MAKFCAKCGSIYPSETILCPTCNLYLYDNPDLPEPETAQPEPKAKPRREEPTRQDVDLGKTLAANIDFEIHRPNKREAAPQTADRQAQREGGAKRRARMPDVQQESLRETVEPPETNRVTPARQVETYAADSRSEQQQPRRPEPTPPEPQTEYVWQKMDESVPEAEKKKTLLPGALNRLKSSKSEGKKTEQARSDEEAVSDMDERVHAEEKEQRKVDWNGASVSLNDHPEEQYRNAPAESPYSCGFLSAMGMLYHLVGWLNIILGVLLAVVGHNLTSSYSRDMYYLSYYTGFNLSSITLPVALGIVGAGIAMIAQGNAIAVLCATNGKLSNAPVGKTAQTTLLSVCGAAYWAGGILVIISALVTASKFSNGFLSLGVMLLGVVAALFIFAQAQKIGLMIDTYEKATHIAEYRHEG